MHWREEEVSQEGQRKADQVDDVWRMKKSVCGRADRHPAVKKGKQALHKEGTMEREPNRQKIIERQLLLQGYGCS